MEGIGSGLGDDVDDVAGTPSVLSGEGVVLNLEILDRVGGGDSFASGLIYGFLAGKDPQWAVECGAAHGALAMTTPGDTTMATLKEVLQVMKGSGARIAR